MGNLLRQSILDFNKKHMERVSLPAGHWAERTDSRKNLFKREKKTASDDTLLKFLRPFITCGWQVCPSLLGSPDNGSIGFWENPRYPIWRYVRGNPQEERCSFPGLQHVRHLFAGQKQAILASGYTAGHEFAQIIHRLYMHTRVYVYEYVYICIHICIYISIYIYTHIEREREAHIMILHSFPHSQDDTPNVLWEPTFMAIAALPLHRALDLQLQSQGDC